MAVVIEISYNGWLTIAIATKCSTNQSCEQVQFGGRVRYKPIIEAFFQQQLPPQKTKMTMEKQPFEDVSLECASPGTPPEEAPEERRRVASSSTTGRSSATSWTKCVCFPLQTHLGRFPNQKSTGYSPPATSVQHQPSLCVLSFALNYVYVVYSYIYIYIRLCIII